MDPCAYFNMCGPQYTSKQMKLILLNKMSKGWGANFSEGWLHKIADNAVLENDKTKELVILDFEKVFLPMDKTSRAQATLADLHMEVPPFKGDFHGFCSAFELEAGKSRVEDKNVLKDMLRQEVSTDLAFKMMSLENKPRTYVQALADKSWSILQCHPATQEAVSRDLTSCWSNSKKAITWLI